MPDKPADIRRKLEAADDLLTVVRTMKALAAANIQQYERAVEAIGAYSSTVELGFRALLRLDPQRLERSRHAGPAPTGMLVIGSDQGMCGSFNEQVRGLAARELEAAQQRTPRQPPRVLAVGQRVGLHLLDEGYTVDAIVPVPSSVAAIPRLVRDLVLRIERWRSETGIGDVRVVHQAVDLPRMAPTSVALLPLDRAWLGRMADMGWESRSLPDSPMAPDALFSSLVTEHLFVSLYRALAESLAGENAARLRAMQTAQRNVQERLDELRARYRRTRQSTITAELMDIVAGFEALRD